MLVKYGDRASAAKPKAGESPAGGADALRPLLTRQEAADLLRISERTLFTLTRRDGIPVVHIGGRVLYNPRDIEAWIAGNTK